MLVLYEAIAVITPKVVINPIGSHLSADAWRTLSSLYLPHQPFSWLPVLPCVLEDTLRRYKDYMIQMESEQFDKKPTSTQSKATTKTLPAQQRLHLNHITLAEELEEQSSDYDLKKSITFYVQP